MSADIKKSHLIGAKDVPRDGKVRKVKTYMQTQQIFSFFLVKTSSLVAATKVFLLQLVLASFLPLLLAETLSKSCLYRIRWSDKGSSMVNGNSRSFAGNRYTIGPNFLEIAFRFLSKKCLDFQHYTAFTYAIKM